MSKTSIKDATVRIKPSPALCSFIAGLRDVRQMPQNVLSIHQLFGDGQDVDQQQQQPIDILPVDVVGGLRKPQLTQSDLDYLLQLNATKSAATSADFQLADILNIEQANDSSAEESDAEVADDSEVAKPLSKTRAKRLREERRERQRNAVRLTLPDLIWLNEQLVQQRTNRTSADSSPPVFLHQLLAGSQLKLPRNEIQARDPVLEARCVRLRLEQDARVYNAMTKNVDTARRQLPDESIAYQMKAINRQMIAVAQFLFSVAAGFAFGFIGVDLIIGNLDFGFRLLLGIICALVIALAEIYFLAKHLNEEYDISVAVDTVVLKGGSAPASGAAPALLAAAKTNDIAAKGQKKPHAD